MPRGKLTRRMTLGLATFVAVIGSAAVAVATVQPTLTYTPPTIKVKDHQAHMTIEDVVIRRDGKDFTFSTPAGFSVDPASDKGCESVVGSVACPREGVKKIVVTLNDMNDSADIGLGKSADKVKQILKGQEGEDTLVGRKGVQTLKGGDQNDTLIGGPGPDVLIGGSGDDICDGGPGHDEFVSCEAAPVR